MIFMYIIEAYYQMFVIGNEMYCNRNSCIGTLKINLLHNGIGEYSVR